MQENKKDYEQLNISVAIFLLYYLDKDLTDIWNKKWKFSKDWEKDFFCKLNSISLHEIEEKYDDFIEIFSDDSSIVFDTKRNRFTDYGSKNDDIKKVKEAFVLNEDIRLNEYNKKNGTDYKNNKKVNSLIYPVDLSFIKINIDDYGMEFEIAENVLFDKKMFQFLDKIKECELIKNIKNVSISKNNSKSMEVENKSFIEYFNENKNISDNEYLDRFKKSYFYKKNGIEALNTLKSSNVIFTDDGSSIIPMSKIDNFNDFKPENIVSYQNIKTVGEGEYFKLFCGSSANSFIKLNKNNELNNGIKRVYIGEGMATCLSSQKLLDGNYDVICAFNADNLVKVVEDLYNKYQDKVEIIVCCDKDKPKLKYNDFYFPIEVKVGKGFLILDNIINLIGNDKIKFALPVFENNIDNSTLKLQLSNGYRKLCYTEDFGRSDFNDKGLDLEQSKNNLLNPSLLNSTNLNNVNFSILIEDNGNKNIEISKIEKLKNNESISEFKKIVIKDTFNKLVNDHEYESDFIDLYGVNGLQKILEKVNDFNIDLNKDLILSKIEQQQIIANKKQEILNVSNS